MPVPTPEAPPGRMTRAQVLRAALAGGGVVMAGGVAIALPGPARSAPSVRQDAEILSFVLLLERLQGALYAEALAKGALTGELREFATTVGGHEREHAAFVEKALGSGVQPPPRRFEFGDATTDPQRFAATAQEIEDLGVAAYQAQAPNLTPTALAAAARIVSVEARHAAWIRDLRGERPAPSASEPRVAAGKVTETLNRAGFVR